MIANFLRPSTETHMETYFNFDLECAVNGDENRLLGAFYKKLEGEWFGFNKSEEEEGVGGTSYTRAQVQETERFSEGRKSMTRF